MCNAGERSERKRNSEERRPDVTAGGRGEVPASETERDTGGRRLQAGGSTPSPAYDGSEEAGEAESEAGAVVSPSNSMVTRKSAAASGV